MKVTWGYLAKVIGGEGQSIIDYLPNEAVKAPRYSIEDIDILYDMLVDFGWKINISLYMFMICDPASRQAMHYFKHFYSGLSAAGALAARHYDIILTLVYRLPLVDVPLFLVPPSLAALGLFGEPHVALHLQLVQVVCKWRLIIGR